LHVHAGQAQGSGGGESAHARADDRDGGFWLGHSASAKQVYHSSFQARYSKNETAMASLPANEYLEIREGGYYLAGTRIGLDVLVHDFRAGKSPEAILQAYPSIGALAKVYGAITFVLEHPETVESYLTEQGAHWKKLREGHSLPDEMGGKNTRMDPLPLGGSDKNTGSRFKHSDPRLSFPQSMNVLSTDRYLHIYKK
jgi:uncharacterized protein (DUF433 family)